MRVVRLTCYHTGYWTGPVYPNNSVFCISGMTVGKFPLTYTVRECAEAWCDYVGWELIHFIKEYNDSLYTLKVSVPKYEDINQTLEDNRIIKV